MSKFWAQSSSDEESEVESSSSEEEVRRPTTTGNRWAFDSDSDSEDEKRVVKSAKEKTWESMKTSIGKLRNAMKIHDWSEIQNYFDALTREYEKPKTRATVAAEGNPAFFIKLLADLEDFLNETVRDKAAQKKMKPANVRAFNRMKLNLKKHNKNFEEEILRFREHPEEFQVEEEESDESGSESDSDDSSDSDSDSDDDSDSDASEDEDEDEGSDDDSESGSDDDSDDSMFGSDSDSSSSSSDSEEEGVSKRLRWVKKDTSQTTVRRERRQDKEPRVKQVRKRRDSEEGPIRTAYRYEEALTVEDIDKRLKELTQLRPKKREESRKYLRHLEGLAKAAVRFGPKKEIQVAMHVVRGKFDNQKIMYDFLDVESWRSCYRYLLRVMTILEENPKLYLGAPVAEDVADTMTSVALGAVEAAAAADENCIPVVGTVGAFTDRLRDEYVKSLQGISAGTHEYERRRYDEGLLVKLAEKVQAYYLRTNDLSSAAAAALLQVEHTYYMHDTHAALIRRTHTYLETWGEFECLHPAANSNNSQSVAKIDVRTTHPAAALGKPAVDTSAIDAVEPAQRMQELCSFVYAHGAERSKARALLAHVFYLAHHDQYHTARDMFFISHIQDSIDRADPDTQVAFNRTLVQLGLSAFRLGYIQKAYDCLHPLYVKGAALHTPIRRLLAQGLSTRFERDSEQERLERRRLVPNHMHLSVELIESVYFVSTLLLELPLIAKGDYHRTSNQRFVKMLERHLSRQRTGEAGERIGMGPPENTQDHIIAGAVALLKGDWKRCTTHILGLPSWNHLSGVGTIDRVKANLEESIKREGVRTYLLRFSQHYESMSLDHLCEMFELPEANIRKVISKMIFEKQLAAAWDNPPDVIVFFKSEPSVLHDAASVFAERFVHMVEANERLLDARTGVYGYKDDWTSRESRYRTSDPQKQWVQQSRRALHGKYATAQRQPRRGPQGGQHQHRPARRGSGGFRETARPHN